MIPSYRQIAKSTALVGGAQLITILVGIIRTKTLAILLGPSGIGLMGLYASITGVIATLTGFGVGPAGVRQIAEAAGSGDDARIALTNKTLRWTTIMSGVLGMALVAIMSPFLARMTFNDPKYTMGVALVSLTVLFDGVSNGQLALLQGLRKLKDLALCTILGSVFGAFVSIILIWWLRENGIVWFIIASSAFTILTSSWFVRRVKVRSVLFRMGDFYREARSLLSLGAAFLLSGFLASGVAYLTRILIVRELGLESVGLYSATWTLSSLYVGMVINAMGTDFYPRLTAASNDNAIMSRLVNEQMEMGILVALPGIVTTLVFASWVLRLFYSNDFIAGAPVIQWMVLGVALRVVSFPMGYILLAKGEARLFAASETVFFLTQLLLLFVCIRVWGLEGVGIVFMSMYLLYTAWIFALSRRVIQFSWAPVVTRLFIGMAFLCITAFMIGRFFAPKICLVVGIPLAMLTAGSCFLMIQKRLNINIASRLRGIFNQ